MVAARYETFLRERTRGINHSGRAFFEHLKGVHDLLRDWGNPEHVCVAGLFHSIYGTQYFKHRCLPLNRRAELVDLIGVEAECLVYEFCTQDRARLRDPQLLEIEAANLIEQGGMSQETRRKLLRSAISGSAKLALQTGIGA
jgi:hypothetical protein